LVSGFDFRNVQMYYDGVRCYETVKAMMANKCMTLMVDPDITVAPKRLQKMLLKGFIIQDEAMLCYIDATVINHTVDLAYDYPIIVNGHSDQVRDNILRMFGLVPVSTSEPLVALAAVPTYPMPCGKTIWTPSR
jgi:hypothetical protein